MNDSKVFLVTREWIKANATTDRGSSWTREQIRCLGIRGEQHSWMFRVIGTTITDEQRVRFEELGARRRERLEDRDQSELTPTEPTADEQREYLLLIRKAKTELRRLHGTAPKKATRVMTLVARAMGWRRPSGLPERISVLKEFIGAKFGIPQKKPGCGIVVTRVTADSRSKTYTPANKPAHQLWGNAFYDSREWQELRYRVLAHYGRKCMCCGTTEGVMHVDHIKPRSKYPEIELEFSNLQVLCKACNKGKGAWDETDWRPKQKPADVFFVEFRDPDRAGTKL